MLAICLLLLLYFIPQTDLCLRTYIQRAAVIYSVHYTVKINKQTHSCKNDDGITKCAL